MFGRGRISGIAIWKPKNPHSLEYLKYLYNLLQKNAIVTEQNRGLLVEALRLIAEILIWGDQNDSTVFDFFLEKNMLAFFLRIMKQKCGRFVCTQLLQTLNILFENIRHDTSLYYLLSNNHINSIITHRFDFSDEEIMAYYISFLKTLSLKLNVNTVHFFFNEHTNDFPLYTEAIKFFNHTESMVRIAVRTLTLNVYRVNDAAMLQYIHDRTAAPYFGNLVWFIGNHVADMNVCLKMTPSYPPEPVCFSLQVLERLSTLLAEHVDHLHYLNDILLLRIDSLNQVLADQLMRRLFVPLYLGSLLTQQQLQGLQSTLPSLVSQTMALFLLSQVFLILGRHSLVDRLACSLLYGDRHILLNSSPPLPLSTSPSQSQDQSTSSLTAEEVVTQQQLVNNVTSSLVAMQPQQPPQHFSVNINRPINERVFWNALLNCLQLTSTTSTAVDQQHQQQLFYALCLLYALQSSTGIDQHVLTSVFPAASMVSASSKNPSTSASSSKNQQAMSLIAQLFQLLNHLTSSRPLSMRLSTVQMCTTLLRCDSFRQLLGDRQLAQLYAVRELATQPLREYWQVAKSVPDVVEHSTSSFLDVFEDECHLLVQQHLRGEFQVHHVSADPALLLSIPMSTTTTSSLLTHIELSKRLPVDQRETMRYRIRVYLLLRDLVSHLSISTDKVSPDVALQQLLSLGVDDDQQAARVDDCVDLNNSDLLACTVVVDMSSTTATSSPQKLKRFLVTDGPQMLLVEPDARKLGFGVVRFVAALQDVEVSGDKEDSRALLMHVATSPARAVLYRQQSSLMLSSGCKLVFDDHIRCMAAKQRLTKGRQKARQHKLDRIAQLLEIRQETSSTAGDSRQQLSPAQQQSSPHRRQFGHHLNVVRRAAADSWVGGIPVPGVACRGGGWPPQQPQLSTPAAAQQGYLGLDNSSVIDRTQSKHLQQGVSHGVAPLAGRSKKMGRGGTTLQQQQQQLELELKPLRQSTDGAASSKKSNLPVWRSSPFRRRVRVLSHGSIAEPPSPLLATAVDVATSTAGLLSPVLQSPEAPECPHPAMISRLMMMPMSARINQQSLGGASGMSSLLGCAGVVDKRQSRSQSLSPTLLRARLPSPVSAKSSVPSSAQHSPVLSIASSTNRMIATPTPPPSLPASTGGGSCDDVILEYQVRDMVKVDENWAVPTPTLACFMPSTKPRRSAAIREL